LAALKSDAPLEPDHVRGEEVVADQVESLAQSAGQLLPTLLSSSSSLGRSPFHQATGRPAQPRPAGRPDVTWYEHACAYAQMKLPDLAAKSRRSTAESLTTITFALTRPPQVPRSRGASPGPVRRGQDLRQALFSQAKALFICKRSRSDDDWRKPEANVRAPARRSPRNMHRSQDPAPARLPARIRRASPADHRRCSRLYRALTRRRPPPLVLISSGRGSAVLGPLRCAGAGRRTWRRSRPPTPMAG
jgi:hypothetical protein